MNSPDLKFKPSLKVLNDDQILQIHLASLEVLERTGVKMTHPRGLEVLDGIGCRVEGDRVRIPSWLVEDALAKTPSRLVLGKRDGTRSVYLEDDKSWFGPSLDCIDYLEPDSGKRVRFTAEHCAATARLADALDNYDWVMTIGMADDQPQEIADKVIARKTLENCTKPYVFCCNDTTSVKAIHEMALLIAGGKENFDRAPTVVHYSEPISPLVYFDLAVDKIIYCAENNIPLINFPAPQAGGTAPMAFAGTVVQGSAESLSGLVLAQNVNPGAPFIYGAFATIMDMRSTIFSYGATELTLMCGALAQMAQFYQIPFFGTAGATDAKFNDAQAGIEATFQTLASAAIGSSLVHDCAAWMDHGSLVSPEYMVMVNEILYRVKAFMNGLTVNKDTLSVDLIDKIGPGGNYLQTMETMKQYKNVFYSDLFDRTMMERWQSTGAKKFEDRLREKTLAAMAIEPEPLPDEIIAELDKMQAGWGK